MDPQHAIGIHIELHDADEIRRCFRNGLSPNSDFNGQPLIDELISEYTRSPKFKDCVRIFIEFGLQFDDKALLSVLADDSEKLEQLLLHNPGIVEKKFSLRCAYTPLFEVSLMHICAEFNHLSCAKVLLKHNADINSMAGKDELGFGGQTPVFHTVNQNTNQSEEMMHFLLNNGADLAITIPGLIWGKGYEWETFIPAVNPISYAMMGLLPQMHRNEQTISETVSLLVKYAYGIDYRPGNVPCKYLKKG